MTRPTKWDWIWAWAGVVLAFVIITYLSHQSHECEAKGGVYVKVWNSYGYQCVVKKP